MKRKCLIAGGYHKAESLARSLLEKGYEVTAVNADSKHCVQLAGIPGLTVIEGDATKPFVLEDAGAENLDLAMALMPRDADNLVFCQLCRKQFHVRKTVSLVSRPERMDFFYRMGIDSVVCALSMITGIVEQQALFEEFTALLPLGKGNLRISELRLPEGAWVIGRSLREIRLSQEVIIAAILRQDQHLVPHGDTRLCAQDVLILIADAAQEQKAVRTLTGK